MSQFICEHMAECRPRERLLNYGVSALSHQELLAIILRTGAKNKDVLELSKDVLTHFGTLYDLKTASIEELMSIRGIGQVKALELLATIEFGLRLSLSSEVKLGQIVSSYDLAQQLIIEMKDLRQEKLMALYLNTKNELIRKETIFIGSINQSVAHPREIFRIAVKVAAARMIIVHNHPSGNPEPSKQDEAFTSRLVKCGLMLGIEVLDHLVIGSDGYVSFKETNRI
ncbi:hypothetical protein CBF34_01930 [Vagococcus penaei]|uniref:Uncharacterized protein n=1 Tax=Vagococcus penaei TaxID=633807 RepID=A0A1Q2D801_9ENTE|nr:DNA repair protein RadC [Vagococcus penaei]AQP54393.1 hypothetical protein BW732_09245 [Vagococcus penaei]RSU06309.1 hypothetical protein CBF34_01930 [Vagococcus penaei]